MLQRKGADTARLLQDTLYEVQALPRQVEDGKTEKRSATDESPAENHGVMDCSATPSRDIRELPRRAIVSTPCHNWG